MAVFGKDFYGLSTYGSNLAVQYDVNPFDANAEGYGNVRVTWSIPAGSWQTIRLLRSRTGYSVDETDGVVLVDSTTSIDNYYDSGLAGGTWVYYTLVIQSSVDQTWAVAGATSALVVKKPWTKQAWEVAGSGFDSATVPYGHADLMWDRIPDYYKYIRADDQSAITDSYNLAPSAMAYMLNPDVYDQENQHLRNMLNVLGWGLDATYNYAATVLEANDPRTSHIQDVDLLAQQLGIDFEFGIPSSVMRSKVANAALLARERGTIEGLKNVATLSTGWDVDIKPGPNLMLNEDQASFTNPQFNLWDPGTDYATGQQVEYLGYIWKALTGAYGSAEKPPTPPTTSNTWWTQITNTANSLLTRSDTNGVVTWKGFQDGTTPQTLSVSIGVSDPVSSSGQTSNALMVLNSTGSAHTYDVVGASNAVGNSAVLPDAIHAVRQGLPIPRAALWQSTIEYLLGAIVQHNGSAWRAIGEGLGNEPSVSSIYWEKVGWDERPLLSYSFYGHGPLTGTTGTGGVSVTPGVAFFDERGNELSDPTTAVHAHTVFDTFNHLSFGTPDVSDLGSTWTVENGTWKIGHLNGQDDKVVYPTAFPSTAIWSVPSGVTQYTVAATFAKAAFSGRTDAIVIRWVDANDWMACTRTAMLKKVAGTISTVTTFSTAFQDGDRCWVSINDTANTFTVYRNKVSVGTGALTGGTSPYNHGIMVY